MNRDPEISIGYKRYRASHLVELIEGLTTNHPDLPSLLNRLRNGLPDAVRRDQEHDGDSLRSGGSSEGRGRGDHSDPTASAAGQEWPYDEVHRLVTGLVLHVVSGVEHLHGAVSMLDRLHALGNQPRRSTLQECQNPNCETTVTGIGEDRLRRGRCERCYRHLVRHDRDWTGRGAEDGEAA